MLPRQAMGFGAAGPLTRSHVQPPCAQPLQAWNPQQARAELEGVGAGSAGGEGGAAGGAVGLGRRHLVVEAAGAQGRERNRGLYPRPHPRPLGVRGWADLM